MPFPPFCTKSVLLRTIWGIPKLTALICRYCSGTSRRSTKSHCSRIQMLTEDSSTRCSGIKRTGTASPSSRSFSETTGFPCSAAHASGSPAAASADRACERIVSFALYPASLVRRCICTFSFFDAYVPRMHIVFFASSCSSPSRGSRIFCILLCRLIPASALVS